MPTQELIRDVVSQEQRDPYQDQIEILEAKLKRGTYLVKRNHRMERLNPDASEVELPLTQTQRQRLEWNLEALRFRQTFGIAADLPLVLRKTNPNHMLCSDKTFAHSVRGMLS